jgi:hypothetical protein
MVRGGLEDRELHITQQRLVGGDQRPSDLDTFVHGRIGKACSHAVTVGFGGDLFPKRWEGRLAGGVWHVRQQRGAVVCQRQAATQESTGGAPRSRRDISLREHPATEQGGNLWRVELVVCGLAAMDGCQRERMPEAKREAFVGPEVSEPVPGAQAFDGDHNPRSIRSNGFQEDIGFGLHMAMHEARAALVEEADVHRSGMQVNAAVQGVLGGVESPEILCRRTGHTHGAMVKLLEAFFTKKELFYDHSNPEPHDR